MRAIDASKNAALRPTERGFNPLISPENLWPLQGSAMAAGACRPFGGCDGPLPVCHSTTDARPALPARATFSPGTLNSREWQLHAHDHLGRPARLSCRACDVCGSTIPGPADHD